MNNQSTLKPITLYAEPQLYKKYQIQAQKQGLKTSDLIRNAMQDYADKHFKTKNNMKAIDFSRTISLRTGESDFLTDTSWKEEFY